MELLIAAGGAAIGGATLGTGVVALGLTGAQIGWMVGGLVGSMLFAPKGPNSEGPRLQDKTVQASTYGNMIPRVYGTMRIAGNVIFAIPLIEKKTVTEYGKGGGGGGSVTTYEYFGTFAVSICEGPITGVRKIWADGVLIFSMATENTESQFDSEVFTGFGDSNKVSSANAPGVQQGVAPTGLVIYLGTEDQEPDPTIEAGYLLPQTPAFRGQAYAVFNSIALKKFGNRIPNLTFEVVDAGESQAGEGELIIPVEDGTEGFSGTWQSPRTGMVWGLGYDNNILTIMDPINKRVVSQLDLSPQKPTYSYTYGNLSLIVPIPYLNQVWITTTGVGGDWWVELSDTGQVLTSRACSERYWVGGLGNGAGYPVGNIGGVVVFNTGYLLTRCWLIDITIETEYYARGGVLRFGYAWYDIVEPQEYFLGCWGDDGYGKPYPERAVLCNGRHYTIAPDIGTQYALDYQNGFAVDSTLDNFVIYDSKRGRFSIPGIDETDPLHLRIVFQEVFAGSIDLYPDTTGPDCVRVRSAIYSPTTDTIAICPALTDEIRLYDAATFTYIRTVMSNNLSYTYIKLQNFAEYGDRLLSWSGYPEYTNPPTSRSGLWSIPLGEKLVPESVPLADIIEAESALVGLSPSDIDVSLLTANVKGFTITRPASARSIIEQLMVAFQFDAVESSGKIKFVPRGGSSSATLTINDIAAHRSGAEVPIPLPINRADENELPTSVTVRYAVETSDYQLAAQEARRQTGNAFTNLVYDLPVVLTDDDAKAVADSSLYSTWVARNTVEFSTTFYYADIEPTDIITVDGKLVRVINKRVEENMLNFKAAFEQGEVYLQGGNAGQTPSNGQTTIDPASRAFAVLMDTVLLRDADNNAPFAFYTAAASLSSSWSGATLFVGSGAGASPMLGYNAAAIIGAIRENFDSYTDNLIDNYNIVTVK